MWSELLSKIVLAVSSSLLLNVCLPSQVTMGSSTILNQLKAGSIMVRAIKSICNLSLPLRVYRSIRLTHKHSKQGSFMTVLGGRCPYFSFCLSLVWQVLQDLVIDWIMVCMPFQYIMAPIVSMRCVCPGSCKQWWYHLAAFPWTGLGITSLPSLQTQVVFSISLISNPLSITALCLKRCFRVVLVHLASAISAVVRGYILSSLLQFANTLFVGMQEGNKHV